MNTLRLALMASCVVGALCSVSAHAAPVPPDANSASYKQGVADRDTWETWFGTVHGSKLEGADWWAGQRSLQSPVPCSAHAASGGDWLSGCLEAKKLLTPSDARRKSDPQYRNGWNKPGSPSEGPQPADIAQIEANAQLAELSSLAHDSLVAQMAASCGRRSQRWAASIALAVQIKIWRAVRSIPAAEMQTLTEEVERASRPSLSEENCQFDERTLGHLDDLQWRIIGGYH